MKTVARPGAAKPDVGLALDRIELPLRGNGRFIEATGKREPLDVKIGDRVVYAKYAGSEIKLDETEYLILSEKDILAVVANGKS